jgi:ABC-2 type transport system permease protein
VQGKTDSQEQRVDLEPVERPAEVRRDQNPPLILGFAFSALAESQMQAMQGAVFFYLPSMLLSGFMFPFQGMPSWARAVGEILPLTHFVRAARGVLLRGEGGVLVGHEMWPVALFAFAAAALALVAYRRRLD